MTRNMRSIFIAVALIAALPAAALALPALQLYSPDAVYDAASETWIITDDTFELWVVGDVGGKGNIYNVDLAASFYGPGGVITITPIGSTPGVALDPTPNLDRPGFDAIVNHEEYRNADGHIFWTLGDMVDDPNDPNDLVPILDYQPGAIGSGTGVIFKYMIHVAGYTGVHFDAFDHYFTGGGGNGPNAGYKPHYVFAPFSHDATEQPPEVPEPGTLLLLGAGLVGLAIRRRR